MSKKIKINRCNNDDCKTIAYYGNVNDEIPTYCENHKSENMADFRDRKCHYIYENNIQCNKRANFGINRAIYCLEHNTNDFKNINAKRCIVCKNKQPSFRKVNTITLTHCTDCKEEDMIYALKEKCIGCKIKIPTYNTVDNKKPSHCADCKTDEMINVKHKRCIKCNIKLASFNCNHEKKALYCGDCKEDNMTNVLNPRCKQYMCNIIVNYNKYDGYCIRCFIYNFPNNSITYNYKTKEKAVADYISDNFSEHTIIKDKIIHGGCSRRRPDILIDLTTHVIIIEIDEDQHNKYDNICENKRLMEISQDLGHPHIVFIRFNPDKYMVNNKIVKSCWSLNKKGISVIKDKKMWDIRLMCLRNIVEYWLNNIPEKHITLLHLFYDTNY